ncbi:hypothetical protein SAMN05421751_1016 [Jhaorihella thermophila]|uniref:Uncharacterized protein n=1 Tax=Jhaorihella thermophila TaxID=488547 RepID=A0A1H5RM08_9RHOB|nr:hypothetical protein SAMN05421751_1016 [Jhaorihella thermophila]
MHPLSADGPHPSTFRKERHAPKLFNGQAEQLRDPVKLIALGRHDRTLRQLEKRQETKDVDIAMRVGRAVDVGREAFA